MFNVGSARGTITTVRVIPPNPTTNDAVRIEIVGWFGDACWSVSGETCSAPSGNQISINIWADDLWSPGGVCATVVVDYARACDYGQLPLGPYLVTVTENHNSLRDPVPNVAEILFEVTHPSPVSTTLTTWGRIKGLFR